MNKRHLGYSLLILFALLTVEAPLIVLNTGCSSPGNAAHKVQVVTMPTVNVAIAQWKDHVLAKKATQAQVDSVKAAYIAYYNAEIIAKSAEIQWINSKSAADQTNYANSAADASTKGAGVVALVTTYMTVK